MGTNTNARRNREGANGGGGPTPSNGVAAENTGTLAVLKHDPGLSSLWSVEEQTILEEGLTKYASEKVLDCYAKVAKELQAKTVRDVALRCKWMSKMENAKKRKEDHNLSKKSRDKRERTSDPSAKPSHLTSRHSGPAGPLQSLPMDTDDDISYQAIGGSAGQLLENTDQIFKQISQNLSNFQQVQENVQLLCQARDNLYHLLNGINDRGLMRQMPPLPVTINEELANSILPSTPMPMQT